MINNTGNNGMVEEGKAQNVFGAVAGALAVATAGLGWLTSWFGYPFVFQGNVASPITAGGVATANVINVVQIVVPFTITIRKFTTAIGQAVLANQFGMGIYDSGGNLLVQGGVSTAAIARVSVAVGPITLTAGQVIYVACTCSSATAACDFSYNMPAAAGASTQGPGIWNMNKVRLGVAANQFVANLMPATLGVISEYTTGAVIAMPAFLMEP